MVIEELFPVPVLIHQIESKLADKIENLIVPRLSYLKNSVGTEKFEVDTDFFEKQSIVSPEEIDPLLEEIHKCKDVYEEKTGCQKSVMEDFWVQNYKSGQFHDIHNHGRVEISGVYWVRADNSPGKFEIFSPNPYLSVFGGNLKRLTKYSAYRQTITPKKGGLILFPGYLDHRVLEGGPNSNRTAIAFNFKPEFYK